MQYFINTNLNFLTYNFFLLYTFFMVAKKVKFLEIDDEIFSRDQ